MDRQKVDFFMHINGHFFEMKSYAVIREKLSELDDNAVIILCALDLRCPQNVFFSSLFLGTFGIDRFILGQPVLGFIKLFTAGGWGLWTLIDLFRIRNATRKRNMKHLLEILATVKYRQSRNHTL